MRIAARRLNIGKELTIGGVIAADRVSNGETCSGPTLQLIEAAAKVVVDSGSF
jgi:hypothetical protein